MSDERRPSVLRSLSLALLAPLTVLLTGCGGPNLLDRLGATNWGLWGTIVIVLDLVALVDLLGDGGRETTSTVIWALLIIFFPVGGVLLYFIFGRG
ncbi:PLDc N-terminal domain-containing protein [Salinibacter altiplanensis]|uniref:PLDc N-terminal domain-containing protein n=1 Tax=Salinibacter altiplanensis TaxID=1803181 RepID=UPI000C9F9131|nr:PLDc N-terminal domain-containing protein [Salinibacter altiplanensis]